jgi:hypothetical protein
MVETPSKLEGYFGLGRGKARALVSACSVLSNFIVAVDEKEWVLRRDAREEQDWFPCEETETLEETDRSPPPS